MVVESTGTTSTVATLGWNQIITIFLSSAVINGVLSAVVNYRFNIRQSKKGREATIIQDKMNLYSILINYTNRLVEIGSDAFPPATNYIKSEYTEILNALDTALSNKYYLLEYGILSKLTWIKMVYLQHPHSIKWDTPISQNDERTIKTELEKLRQMLVTTYRNTIIPEYGKIAGKNTVQKLVQNIQ